MTISINEEGIGSFKPYNGSEYIYVPATWWQETLRDNIDVKEYTIPASKGKDTLGFVDIENIDELSFQQGIDEDGKLTKDLWVTYSTEKEVFVGDESTGIGDWIKEPIEHKVILKNYFKTTKGDATSLNYYIAVGGYDGERYSVTDRYQHQIENPTKNTVGTVFSDYVISTSNNETFTLKQGENWINFDETDGFGNDTIVLTKGETLDLQIVDTDENILSQNELYYKTSGNDLIIKIDKDDAKNSIKVKNFAKTNSGATLQINGENFAGESNVYATGTKSNTFAGSRLNEVAESTNEHKNETFKLGTGTDRIIFSADDIGKDTIVLGKGENLTLEGLDKDNLSFRRSGNNIIITDSDRGSITVKNYLKDIATVYVNNQDTTLADLINRHEDSTFLTYNKKNFNSKKKAVKLTGTQLDETFYGSAKNDTIKAGKGNDTLIGGKGNDKLYGGEGENTYSFSVGDGKDTIYATKGSTNIVGLDEKYTDRDYKISGNDVILINTYTPENDNTDRVLIGNKVMILLITKERLLKQNLKKVNIPLSMDCIMKTSKLKSEAVITDTITLKDYLKDEYDVTVWQYETGFEKDLKEIAKEKLTRTIGSANSSKSQTINGSFIPETIYGGKKADKIYTGEGNDIVTAGKGNDTIYLDGEGNKTLNFAKGDGDDTVYINADSVTTNLVFDTTTEEPTLTYEKVDNDLIVHSEYSGGVTNNVTIKDYFGYIEKAPELTINGTDFEDLVTGENGAKILLNATEIEYTPTDETSGFSGLAFDFHSFYSPLLNAFYKDYNWKIVGSKYGNTISIGDGYNSIDVENVDYSYISTGNYKSEDENNDSKTVGKNDISIKNSKEIYVYGESGDSVITFENSTGSISVGDGDDRITIVNSMINYVMAGEGDDYISLINSGAKQDISGSKGNDTYYIEGLDKDIKISDGSGNDTLIINSTTDEKLTFFFNIDKDSRVAPFYEVEDVHIGITNDLMIFNENNIENLIAGKKDIFSWSYNNTETDNITGGININSYFPYYDEKFKDESTYKIETIQHIVEGTTYNIDIDSYIDEIKSKVVEWLSNTDYQDALCVIEKGTGDEIESLIKCYQVNYQTENNVIS